MVELSKATLERLSAMFGEDDQGEATRLLAERCGNNLPFCKDSTPRSLERIRFAVLKLSEGDIEALVRAVEAAETDWR